LHHQLNQPKPATMSKNNNSNPASLSNNLVHIRTSDINFSNYVKPIGFTLCDKVNETSQDDSGYIPLPHQEQPGDPTDTDSNTSSVPVNLKPPSSALKLKTSLKMVNPAKTSDTPNLKTTPSSVNKKQTKSPVPSDNATGQTHTPRASNVSHNKTNDNEKMNSKPPTKSAVLPVQNKNKEKDNKSKDSFDGSDTENSTEKPQRYLPHRKLFDIYDSPYLNKIFKPTLESLNLTQEQEPLAPLILWQHEVLTKPIINLAATNLTLTEILEKKKESSQLLHDSKKIPRSLRIKCELTTSPSYTSHPSFLKLKDDLKQQVSTFITNETKILAEWANIYIQLLTVDRCTDIMNQALQILDCLTTFYVGAIGTPLWPSVDDRHLTLFLFKAYLSNSYYETNDLAEYLGLSLQDILLIGAKHLTKSDYDKEVTKILDSLKLSDIDMENLIDKFFLSKTLLNFDQILKISTLGTWHHQKEQAKQALAAANMKSKLKSPQMVIASTATALAIAKATENLDHHQVLSIKTNPCISNLEKMVNKQEQKSNGISDHLKNLNKKTTKEVIF
jgi:hypothetical protein